jgi:hypothetical protein
MKESQHPILALSVTCKPVARLTLLGAKVGAIYKQAGVVATPNGEGDTETHLEFFQVGLDKEQQEVALLGLASSFLKELLSSLQFFTVVGKEAVGLLQCLQLFLRLLKPFLNP